MTDEAGTAPQDYKMMGDILNVKPNLPPSMFDLDFFFITDEVVIHVVHVSRARGFSREDTLYHYGVSGETLDKIMACYEADQTRFDAKAAADKFMPPYLASFSQSAEDRIDHLEKLLYDPVNLVRSSVARQLVATGDRRAIQAVVRCFFHPIDSKSLEDAGDISSCSAALRTGGEAAVSELIPSINQRKVMWLLGYIGHESSVEPLIAAYSDAGQLPIISALGNIGSPRALPFLRGLLAEAQDNPSMTAWIKEAIQKIERKTSSK